MRNSELLIKKKDFIIVLYENIVFFNVKQLRTNIFEADSFNKQKT
jgi:hypothetical protein